MSLDVQTSRRLFIGGLTTASLGFAEVNARTQQGIGGGLSGEARPKRPASGDILAMKVFVGERLPRFGLVLPGARRYLRYTVRDGRRDTVDIWNRNVRFEKRAGREVMVIDQRWDRVVAPVSVRLQESVFELNTFSPITHVNRVEKDGVTSVSAYRFEDDKIIADASVSGNLKSGIVQVISEPTFNFETDLEQFQAMAWGPGYAVNLMFYDPGLAAPARYTFRTVGSVAMPGPNGTESDCWLVTADYNTGKLVKKFWIAKASQLVIHEEAERDGVVYVKTLIGAEASDLRAKSRKI